MIFLMLFSACEDDPSIDFGEKEMEAYLRVMEDHKSPAAKWGFINKEDELVIDTRYDELRRFSDGVASANFNGVWGAVDNIGRTVIPFRFKDVGRHTENRIVAQDFLGKYHLFDGEGVLVKDSLDFNSVEYFSEGLAKVSKDGRYGYINQDGNVVIDIRFEQASKFSDSMAVVTKEGKQLFINDKGIAITGSFDRVYRPKDDMMRIKSNGKYHFLSYPQMKYLYGPFSNATDYFNGYAVVNNGDKYELIDRQGTIKKLPYSYVDVGGENKWIYQAGDKFGFLNTDGSVLTLPNFDLVMRYQEGRAGVSVNDSWGYIDKKGEVLVAPYYPIAWDFVEGYARIISPYGFGFIDSTGHEVIETKYLEVRDFSENRARVQMY